DTDVGHQREVVDAFFAAARGGDLEGLVAVLSTDVILRAHFGRARPGASAVVHGAAAVARQARLGANPEAELHPAVVHGAPGMVITVHGGAHAVMAFVVAGGQIVEIDVINDPERATRLAASF